MATGVSCDAIAEVDCRRLSAVDKQHLMRCLVDFARAKIAHWDLDSFNGRHTHNHGAALRRASPHLPAPIVESMQKLKCKGDIARHCGSASNVAAQPRYIVIEVAAPTQIVEKYGGDDASGASGLKGVWPCAATDKSFVLELSAEDVREREPDVILPSCTVDAEAKFDMRDHAARTIQKTMEKHATAVELSFSCCGPCL